MCSDAANASVHQFEIGANFRRLIEARIARLESDAALDEVTLLHLQSGDHIRRHMRLVATQRDEALRMRRFLDHCHTAARARSTTE